MKAISQTGFAALLAIGVCAQQSAVAQQSGLSRTDVLQHDLGNAGREVVQTRVDFAPRAVSPRHSHPGEEIAYVLEGTLEYQIEGRAPVTVQAGQALFIPAGTNHIAKNVGTGKSSELATYLVTKGVPLLVIAK